MSYAADADTLANAEFCMHVLANKPSHFLKNTLAIMGFEASIYDSHRVEFSICEP